LISVNLYALIPWLSIMEVILDTLICLKLVCMSRNASEFIQSCSFPL
jgi:hypothetical protein